MALIRLSVGASPDSYLCVETVRLLAETVDFRDAIINSDQGSSYTKL